MSKINTGGYEVKKVKCFNTPDGGGFNCDLYKDGVKIASVFNGGNGGCHDYSFGNRQRTQYHDGGVDELKALQDFCKSLGKYEDEDGPHHIELDWDVDLFVSHLIDEFESNKKLARLCKTKCVIRLKEDRPDEIRTFKFAYTPQLGDQIRKKYGDNLLEIVNETISK